MELYKRTDIYDLLETEERYQAVKTHWQTLQELAKFDTLLDCSIGSGNLTLPLCELGVQVFGSDLSYELLEACDKKAKSRGFSLKLRQSDFRRLSEAFDCQFDCVASTGNSLPHVENRDVLLALEQMDKLVKPGGYLYYDMRNWDKILKERNRFYLYNPQFLEDARLNLMQVWDYNPDGSMTFHLLYTFERDGRIFQKEKFEETYFPIRRSLLLDKLEKMGYVNLKIMCHPAQLTGVAAENADWYCVLAQKKG